LVGLKSDHLHWLARGHDGEIMEMTWNNLTKLFTWAAKQGSDAPLADTAGEAIVIDGVITKEDFERFMKSQSELPEV
jgi:hypothetical protein